MNFISEQLTLDLSPEITKKDLINRLYREIACLRISKMNFDHYKRIQMNEIAMNKNKSV